MSPSDTEEIKRHFNVVAESLERKIQLVAESVVALDEKVESTPGRHRGKVGPRIR